jgi:hypothetical protein
MNIQVPVMSSTNDAPLVPTAPMSDPETDTQDFVPASEKVVEDKMVHVLTIWPQLSPSMLQVGIGTALPPKLWHPVLERLIAAGVIERREVTIKGPSNRDQTHTLLRLAMHSAKLSNITGA